MELTASPWTSSTYLVLPEGCIELTLSGTGTNKVVIANTEGRIEPSDGTLMCSYHGWRFRGDGACTKIPQALDSKAEQAACTSGRSCAAVYPTQVHIHPSIGSCPTINEK